MVSLPDELLVALDAEAVRRGTTRSGLLRHYADEALRRRAEERAQRVDALLEDVRGHGGDGRAHLKRDRARS